MVLVSAIQNPSLFPTLLKLCSQCFDGLAIAQQLSDDVSTQLRQLDQSSAGALDGFRLEKSAPFVQSLLTFVDEMEGFQGSSEVKR
jgi:hypothetical protein